MFSDLFGAMHYEPMFLISYGLEGLGLDSVWPLPAHSISVGAQLSRNGWKAKVYCQQLVIGPVRALASGKPSWVALSYGCATKDLTQ